MSQMASGKVLRETRERKGYDLATVARRLRIRPDILRAIEAGDFAAMPPRGYTRNMVNAYARLLGLNPTEIVNMYLDEVYADQVERARGNAPSSGFNMDREPRFGRSRPREMRDLTNTGAQNSMFATSRPSRDAATGRYSRVLYDDRTQFSRDDYGITRERTARPGRSDRDFLSHHSGYSEAGYGSYDVQRGRGRAVHVGETPMQYSASRMPSFLQSRAVLVVAIAAVVIVVLAVVFLFLGSRNAPTADDVSQLPVSGINDTTGTADVDTGSTAAVEIAPTSAHVVITVDQGEDCYLEGIRGDDITPYNLVGPAQESIEVTDVWTIATWTPDAVTVTVDGTPVELKDSDSYNGMAAYTVDFPAILEQWKATHTSREAQRSAAVATAEAGTSQTGGQSAQSGSSEGSADS